MAFDNHMSAYFLWYLPFVIKEKEKKKKRKIYCVGCKERVVSKLTTKNSKEKSRKQSKARQREREREAEEIWWASIYKKCKK